MRILIIEDNAFNAFCLQRLLESVIKPASITIANNSHLALSFIHHYLPDMVIVDGHLGAARYANDQCHGPELVDILLHKYPQLLIIAWTNSPAIKEQFEHVFNQHQKKLTHYNSWAKPVNVYDIQRTYNYYFDQFLSNEPANFSYKTSTQYSLS